MTALMHIYGSQAFHSLYFCWSVTAFAQFENFRSELLKMTPDFEEIPNLEQIIFEGCVKLVQIDPSIGVLRKLFFLNLKDCITFSINNVVHLEKDNVSIQFLVSRHTQIFC
jgi:hypothetical protein